MRFSIWKLIGFLLLLSLLAFFLWTYDQIEYVEEKRIGDFKGAALSNPLLAAGRLAERYGATAHYVPAYSKPPQSGATLVFAAPRYWLSQKQNDALLDWVKTKGGHLVVYVRSLWDYDENTRVRSKNGEKKETSQDPLLDYLGVYSYSSAPDNKEGHEIEKAFQGLLQAVQKQEVELPDGVHLNVQFDPQLRLFEDPDEGDLGEDSDWRISEPGRNKGEGHYGLGYRVGNGRITVLTSLNFINNAMIGKDDHAALFVYLTSLAKGQDIWFVYGSDVPALWRWLVHYAWPVLNAAAILLIIWLWAIPRRFGPLLPTRPAARRSIVEHVAASARYLWRSEQGQALYRTLCDDFYKRAYLRYPQWSRLPQQELYRQVALFAHETRAPQLSGLTEQAVGYLLDTSHPRDERQFTAHSHLLDILRNKL
ncbi:MAG: DUF4350 domain-containing protein [Betaproteobacteria bacterium]|nr:DUF4350 domain-containing protein [Betaproteobacteria bacterium]